MNANIAIGRTKDRMPNTTSVGRRPMRSAIAPAKGVMTMTAAEAMVASHSASLSAKPPTDVRYVGT